MKNYIYQNKLLVIISLFFVSIGCQNKLSFEEQAMKELESGVKYDSLFLGYYLGMPEQFFFDHCRVLHKEGVIDQGNNGMSILYRVVEDNLSSPIDFNFFPSFTDEVISSMEMTVNYRDWAPWNNNLNADSLLFDIQPILIKWFPGNQFMPISKKQILKEKIPQNIFGKVDGNRQIFIYQSSISEVTVIIKNFSRK